MRYTYLIVVVSRLDTPGVRPIQRQASAGSAIGPASGHRAAWRWRFSAGVGQPREHVAVAGRWGTPAARCPARQLWGRGEQLRLRVKPAFVALDDLRAGAVAADHERVAPFGGAPDVDVVFGALAVHDQWP
jgi:hypothetical protein